MKRGYLGPFQLGVLFEGAHVLGLLAKATKQQRGVDLDAVFYASAFQAGIDEFAILPPRSGHPVQRSQFVAARTSTLSGNDWETYHELVNTAFSNHLPEHWRNTEQYQSVSVLTCFIVDVLYSMSVGASLLWTRIPDFSASGELLPIMLRAPLSHFFAAVKEYKVQGPTMQKVLLTEDAQRFTEILSSDLFTKYSAAQSSLDDTGVEVEAALPAIAAAGHRLVARRQRWLSLRESGLGILQITPRLVDAVFGKLPGALADAAAKLGINFLESRRRLVIYDLGESYDAGIIRRDCSHGDAGRASSLQNERDHSRPQT